MKTTSVSRSVQLLGLALLLGHGAACRAQAATPAAPTEPTLDVRSYAIEGDNPLVGEDWSTVLAPFTGPNRKLGDIEAAAAAIEKAMRERGYAFHRMFVPVQKPVDGVIRLQVIGIKVGQVEVSGNERFTTDNIRRSLTSLREGEVPEVQTLGRDVTASNANPAKQVSVTFKESAEPGKVDAVVKVKDSPTLVFFTSLTGNQSASKDAPAQNSYRLTGGVQHSNLFDRDHVATVSYTTDPDNISGVHLFGAYYQVPLYGTGFNVSAYYTKSSTNSGSVQQGPFVFDVSGSGRFMGVRLTRALTRVNSLQQTLGVTLDDRLFSNSTTVNGAVQQPDVSSRVLSGLYGFRFEPEWGDLAGGLEYHTNIGGGSRNTIADHAANGGEKNWAAWRFNLEASTGVAGWQATGRFRGQQSGDTLITLEQFGLGGASSVRGFADRVVSGDSGYHWSLEALGPSFTGYALRPVVFVDGGRVLATQTTRGETLSSVGVGLRMVQQNLQLAVDLAQVVQPLHAQAGSRPRRLHMAVSYRF